ncbi:MAG: ferredoxin [Desulfobacteraceae bacterium]|nr:MAG: ferredoxin [Desulfobacteraceae bacterium]
MSSFQRQSNKMQEPVKLRTRLEVKTELCLACGVCAQVCDRYAIWFLWGRAVINQYRCGGCGRCMEACGHAAIEQMKES